MVPKALSYAVYGEFLHGSLATATEHASLGLRLSTETGQRNCAAHHLAVLAMLAALRGDAEECATRVAAVTEHTDSRPLGLARALTEWALAYLDLTGAGCTRPRPASKSWRAASLPGPPTIRLLSVPHYVEAAVHIGETQRAEAALASFEQWANATQSPNDLALVARCRALLSDGETAREYFEEALNLHRRGGGGGIEEARTRMAYGTLLRRSRLPSAARPHLRAAVEAFTRLETPLLLQQAKEQCVPPGGARRHSRTHRGADPPAGADRTVGGGGRHQPEIGRSASTSVRALWSTICATSSASCRSALAWSLPD